MCYEVYVWYKGALEYFMKAECERIRTYMADFLTKTEKFAQLCLNTSILSESLSKHTHTSTYIHIHYIYREIERERKAARRIHDDDDS